MSNDDRTHTTSWDGGEVRRQIDGQSARKPISTGRSTGKKRKKKKRRMNPLLAIVIWGAFVAVSSVTAASIGWMLASDFAALNKGPRTEIQIQVPPEWVTEVETVTEEDGTAKEVTHYDMEKVAAALKEKGLIKYDWFFRLFCKFYHADTKIDQGNFTLNTEMDYMALIRYMRPTAGDAKAEEVKVTIPEGYSMSQIIALLAENGVGTEEDLTECAANYDFSDFPFIGNDNLGDPRRLEGYLFPDTYYFYVGGRPQLAFNKMLDNFDSKVYSNAELTDLLADAENRGYDLQSIITIASLIEKETDGTDRNRIASVIFNRLENSAETAYFLQIDAALVYAAGREITQEDYTSLDSPYNLYQHTGLPPTPICNPGLTSIGAALQPADTNYYFYVKGADGKHIFNETLAGHNRTLAELGNG